MLSQNTHTWASLDSVALAGLCPACPLPAAVPLGADDGTALLSGSPPGLMLATTAAA